MLVGIVTLIISAVVVFNHQLVWLLAVFPGLYIAYAYFLAFAKPPELNSDIQASLTSEEGAAWGQFHVFLRFGMAAPAMSRTLTILQVLSVITGIALAVTGLYWGLLIALGWFALAPLTPRLNPVLYLSDAAKRGNLEARVQLESLESLYEKLQSSNKIPTSRDSNDGAMRREGAPVSTKTPIASKTVGGKERERFKGLTQQQAVDLNELIENWSVSILKAPLIVWTQDDLLSQSNNAARASREIYATAGMVYLAEHMVSQNIKSKAKVENFANKLIDKVADGFAEQMLNDNTTRADKAEFSNMVKKGYFYYWTRKEAADNTPKGTTDMVIDKLHELDSSLGKRELTERLRDYLVGQRFGDFADITSHILGRLNTDRNE